MVVKSFVFNPFHENTYVIHTDRGEAMVIDPGCYTPAEESNLQSYLTEKGLVLQLVVNTHLHFDHLFGNRFLEETYGIHALAHQADLFLLETLEKQAAAIGFQLRRPKPILGGYLKEGDRIQLGEVVFEVLELPGHTPGGLAFYQPDYQWVFVGDALFAGSIGRTDLEGGSYEALIEGLRNKIGILPDETIVYSGHGPSTTVGREKRTNPYLQLFI
jgi:glyoxylase-like metal-dependent hydrolase (beta-lactamase superfamily II)